MEPTNKAAIAITAISVAALYFAKAYLQHKKTISHDDDGVAKFSYKSIDFSDAHAADDSSTDDQPEIDSSYEPYEPNTGNSNKQYFDKEGLADNYVAFQAPSPVEKQEESQATLPVEKQEESQATLPEKIEPKTPKLTQESSQYRRTQDETQITGETEEPEPNTSASSGLN